MTSKRDVERRLDELDGGEGDTLGERPEPLTDEERRTLDEFFSPPFDAEHDRVMREMYEQGQRFRAEMRYND